jgi:hypothetical protein
MNDRQHSPLDRDRLAVLAGALVLGLGLGRLVVLPIRPITANILGSPFGLALGGSTLVLVLMTGMGATASASLVGSHPQRARGGGAMHWLLPAMMAAALAVWLIKAGSLALWAAGLALSALLLSLSLAVEYAAVDPDRRREPLLAWAQLALVQIAALLWFSAIFDLRARALVGSPAVLALATLLGGRLFWTSLGRARPAFGYGAAIGLMLAMLNWTLTYWRLSSLQGGVMLFLGFYVLSGLVQQHLAGPLTRRSVLEHLAVAVAVLLVIARGVR